MLRPKGKPQKIAEAVMKGKGVKIPNGKSQKEDTRQVTPYLQHWGYMGKKMSAEHMKEYAKYSPAQLKAHMKQEKELVKSKVKSKKAKKK